MFATRNRMVTVLTTCMVEWSVAISLCYPSLDLARTATGRRLYRASSLHRIPKDTNWGLNLTLNAVARYAPLSLKLDTLMMLGTLL